MAGTADQLARNGFFAGAAPALPSPAFMHRRARTRPQFRPFAAFGSNVSKQRQTSLHKLALDDSEQRSAVPDGCTFLLRAKRQQRTPLRKGPRLFVIHEDVPVSFPEIERQCHDCLQHLYGVNIFRRCRIFLYNIRRHLYISFLDLITLYIIETRIMNF